MNLNFKKLTTMIIKLEFQLVFMNKYHHLVVIKKHCFNSLH